MAWTSGFESRAAILRGKLKDPVRNPDIDTEVESLRDAVESLKRIEARRRIELERERDSQERTKKVLELVMKQDALGAQAVASKEEVAKVLAEAPQERDERTNLIPPYTFESYIVGESNRFAHAAAVAGAKQPAKSDNPPPVPPGGAANPPAKSYNPLLVTSGPGLGKTHLLHAIGNHIVSHHGGAKVLYMTCEAFATGFEESRGEG